MGIAVAVTEFVGLGTVAVGPGVAVAAVAQDEIRITARKRKNGSFMNLPFIEFCLYQKLYFTTL